jgi:transcriptional regulator with XRE-family HTH domain
MSLPRARTALAERLRKARLDAGLTGKDLTEMLGSGWGQPKISKIETGRQLPSETDAGAWARATGVDPAEFLALLRRARYEFSTSKDKFDEAGGAAAQQDATAALERASKLIALYSPQVVPGFLQTPAYAQAMLTLPGGPTDKGATPEEISRMVASRMRRAAVLYEPEKKITLVVGQGALQNLFVPRAIMISQLEHIAMLAETITTATIGIVPYDRQLPVLAATGWDLTDDLLKIETPLGTVDVTDPIEVRRYTDYVYRLLEVAETGPAAAERCRFIAADLRVDNSDSGVGTADIPIDRPAAHKRASR